MNADLAENVLSAVLDWSEEEAVREIPVLVTLARVKYNEYQQFLPGRKFIESLAMWLNQFERHERKAAYDFVRKRLIFISQREMMHLVRSAFPDYLRPVIVEEVAAKIGASKYQVCRVTRSSEFKLALARSLFVGLSDGAHIDWFRRSNPQLSHEQIFLYYDISKTTAERARMDLGRRVRSISKQEQELYKEELRFQYLVLLDDFSATGMSAIRRSKKNQYAGKLWKIRNQLFSPDGALNGIFDLEECKVILMLYVATEQAIRHIHQIAEGIDDLAECEFRILPILRIPDTVKVSKNRDPELIPLIEKYYDPSIETSATSVGGSDLRFGFGNSALPIVLFHNTPNNSIYLLQADDRRRYKGLFPRVPRHKDDE